MVATPSVEASHQHSSAQVAPCAAPDGQVRTRPPPPAVCRPASRDTSSSNTCAHVHVCRCTSHHISASTDLQRASAHHAACWGRRRALPFTSPGGRLLSHLCCVTRVVTSPNNNRRPGCCTSSCACSLAQPHACPSNRAGSHPWSASQSLVTRSQLLQQYVRLRRQPAPQAAVLVCLALTALPEPLDPLTAHHTSSRG